MNWTEEQLAEHYARVRNDGGCGGEDCPPGPAPQEPKEDTPERLIQAECVKFMEEDGWRPLRTDPVSDKGRGKGFGELGMADYMFIRYMHGSQIKVPSVEVPVYTVILKHPAAQILWVEFKSRNGEPKKHQTEWHTKERARGALTWIASVDFPASVEGFREYYQKSGLMRRPRWW